MQVDRGHGVLSIGGRRAWSCVTGAPARFGPVVCRWQYTVVVSTVKADGSTSRHTSITYGQRVWKLHPGGGSAGDGMSPCSVMRVRARWRVGFGIGMADSNASVYG